MTSILNVRQLTYAQLDALQHDVQTELQTRGVRRETLQRLHPLNEEEWHMLWDHKLVSAIKSYRNRTGCTLAEAKDIIDLARDRY